MKRTCSIVTLCSLFTLTVLSVHAVNVPVPIIADTLLAGHSAEFNTNSGARQHLRVKGWQGVVVFRFDMSLVEGFKANGGTLSVYTTGITGDAAGSTVSEVISTISHDWIEGTGDYTFDESSATYAWPGEDIADEWGDDNEELSDRYGPIDCLDVVGGFGGSIVNEEGEWDFTVDEWTDIELDAELVQGLIDGEQYGIAVMRESIGVNLDLASREAQPGVLDAKLVVDSSGLSVDAMDKLATTWGILKR